MHLGEYAVTGVARVVVNRLGVLSPQLADDADEELHFLLESIDRVEISARRYRLFGHPVRFLFIEGGWEMVP